MADRVGHQLGNYRLMQLLGQGNFAEVYLGEHLHLNTQAAIKVLHAHFTSQDGERFRTEARTIARLVHPHIVRILDFDVEEGLPFLVMDYAAGGSLRQRYPKGTRLPLDTVVSYVIQVASALQYAHDAQLIHRDIKPENLLLGRTHEVLLGDFGLVLITQSSHSKPVQETAGTIAYMAPEQLQAHPTPASDQYALGVVVYEWLSGDRPFHGSFPELALKQTLVSPPSLCEQVPTLPPAVEQVVFKALAKDPQQRFPSVWDFALALQEAGRGEPSSGHTLFVLSSHHSAQARQAPKHTLPAQLTPLIGRAQEVAAACALLRRPEVRLVTLTGTGGVGKTRLGLQVATDLFSDFPDGVSFVSLAPISDPNLVIPTIAQTLGIKEAPGQALLDLLSASLREKKQLLLLDNFEQVLGAAVEVAALLAGCPRLKVLVTSRAGLHVRGEQEFAVPPLAVPDPTHFPDLITLSQSEAVALFISRAQAVQPEFQVTKTNAPAVAEICVRLDGLPLAIELAAARSQLLPPQALLSRLSHRFHVLTSGAQDAPRRQQTLRNTLAWSYDLLSPGEQRLFRHLAVFVGGCTLEAIEALCTALESGAAQVLDSVASLLDKNLLQQRERDSHEPRLLMLETIREYGLEALEASGEIEVTHKAHATYYLAWAEEAEPELAGLQQAVWLERLEREHDNLRAALRWSLERGEAGQSMEMALRLAGALRRFWEVRGHVSEGWIFLERALAGSKGGAGPVQMKALKAAAHLAFVLSNNDQAEALSKECLARCRELGDTAGVALSLRLLGAIALGRYHFAEAIPLTEESLALFREVEDKEGIAWSLHNLAGPVSMQGEYARAISLEEESLALFRALGNVEGIAYSLIGLAFLLILSQGDQATGRALLEESLARCREVGHKEGIVLALGILGQVALLQGDAGKARSLLEESLALFRELGQRNMAWVLIVLRRVAACQGDYAAAKALYEESLSFVREVGFAQLLPPYLEGLADMVAIQGDPAQAARLWGLAEAQREAMGAPISPVERASYERAVAAARTQLGEQAFAAAWAEGRAMTAEQALVARGPVTMPTPVPTTPPSSPPPAQSPPTSPDGLTAREVEVLRLVAQGLSNAEIAEQLIISLLTVKAHMRSLYNKLGISSRSAATRYAIEHHLM